jgi:hypothetical protein
MESGQSICYQTGQFYLLLTLAEFEPPIGTRIDKRLARRNRFGLQHREFAMGFEQLRTGS